MEITQDAETTKNYVKIKGGKTIDIDKLKELIEQKRTYKEIAFMFNVSTPTVKKIYRDVMTKKNVLEDPLTSEDSLQRTREQEYSIYHKAITTLSELIDNYALCQNKLANAEKLIVMMRKALNGKNE